MTSTQLENLTWWQAAVYTADRATITTSVVVELIEAGVISADGTLLANKSAANAEATRHGGLSPAALLMLKHIETHDGSLPDAEEFTRHSDVDTIIQGTIEDLKHAGYYEYQKFSFASAWETLRSIPPLAFGVLSGVIIFLYLINPEFAFLLVFVIFGLCVGGPTFTLILVFLVGEASLVRSPRAREVIQELVQKYRYERPLSPWMVSLFGARRIVEIEPETAKWITKINPNYRDQFGFKQITHLYEWLSPATGTSLQKDPSSNVFEHRSVREGSNNRGSGGSGGGCGACGGCGG